MGVQTPDRVDRQGTHVFHIADMGTFLKKSVHLDGDLVEPASARGECEVPLSLFAEKERGPEFGLQGFQLLAESRLRHEEVAGGLVQGTGLCDRQEHADIILIHEQVSFPIYRLLRIQYLTVGRCFFFLKICA